MRPPEDYFEHDEDGIRQKGHRVWIEDILDLYKEGLPPEQINDRHHLSSLTRDDVLYAAIAYYHAHTAKVNAYMEQQTREALERERDHPAIGPPNYQSRRAAGGSSSMTSATSAKAQCPQ